MKKVKITAIVILLLSIASNTHAIEVSTTGGKVLISIVTGAKFILISGGTFTMGDASTKNSRHQVTISKPFYMQTTLVTQGQWQKIMGSNPSHFKNCGDDCPVETVSWNDVQDFIGRLNRQEGTDKYRLPTEAEWEYSARNAGKEEIWAGTSSESDLGNYAWYRVNSDHKTHPVGQKRPNGLGLYDMTGNVCEWCWDWYGGYPPGNVTDPTGPSSGSSRVFRGGSWLNSAGSCRSSSRGYAPRAMGTAAWGSVS